jgi:hypothetical protein
MKKTFVAVLVIVILSSSGLAPLSAFAQSSQPLDVNVKNFPEKQEVKGSVSVEGSISHAKYFKKEGVVVPTSRRNELGELISAGTVETDGFTKVTMSLQGEIKSGSFTPGTVGVLLIPDEEPIVRSLREAKRVQFPIEGVARLKTGDPTFFESEQTQQRIAFPRYRVYLYNTLNRSVEANVYLYLSN